MVRISTTYDKDIKKKVFLVRGDEAYAKSTDCEVVVGNITTGEMKGLKIANITINLYRTLGKAQLVLYDDEMPIESWNITTSTTSKTLTNYYLGYNATHNLWAEYIPLDHQCLDSKSKRVEVFKEIPSSLLVNFTENSASKQVNTGADLTFDYTVKKGSSNVPNGTSVLVYVDDEYVNTVTTTSGRASSTISNVPDGKHTVRLEVETSDNFYGNSIEYTAMVGYQVAIESYPQQFINGTNNEVTVSVRDYDNEVVGGQTVNIYRQGVSSVIGSGTVTDGVANITITSIPSTDEYYATYGGSYSNVVVFNLYSSEDVTISASRMTIGNGETSTITVKVSDGKDGVPIQMNVTGKDTSYITTVNGIGTYTYNGTGRGTISIEASVGEESDSLTIHDTIAYWNTNANHSTNFNDTVTVNEGSMIVYSNYICLRDALKTSGGTSGTSNGQITFNDGNKIVRFTIAKKPLNVDEIIISQIGTQYALPIPSEYWDEETGKWVTTDPTPIDYDSNKGGFVIPISMINVGSVIEFDLCSSSKFIRIDDIKTDIINTVLVYPPPEEGYNQWVKFNTLNGGELYIKDLEFSR